MNLSLLLMGCAVGIVSVWFTDILLKRLLHNRWNLEPNIIDQNRLVGSCLALVLVVTAAMPFVVDSSMVFYVALSAGAVTAHFIGSFLLVVKEVFATRAVPASARRVDMKALFAKIDTLRFRSDVLVSAAVALSYYLSVDASLSVALIILAVLVASLYSIRRINRGSLAIFAVIATTAMLMLMKMPESAYLAAGTTGGSLYLWYRHSKLLGNDSRAICTCSRLILMWHAMLLVGIIPYSLAQ